MNKTIKLAVFFALTVLGLFVLSSIVMYATGSCPPSGPWPMPPWCLENSQESGLSDALDEGLAETILTDTSGTVEGEILEDDDQAEKTPVELNQADETPQIIKSTIEVITPRSEKDVVIKVGEEKYMLDRTNEIYATKDLELPKGEEYVLEFGLSTKKGTISEHIIDHFPEQGVGREFGKGFYLAACHYCDISYTRGNFIEPAKKSYKEIKEAGASWVNLIPVWFVDDYKDHKLRPVYREEYGLEGKSGWQHATITDDELRTLISEAHKAGLKVYLSPHIATLDWGPGVLGKNDWAPTDVEGWSVSFKNFTEHYSKIAEETGVELYSIGNELGTLDDPNHENNPGVTKEHWYKIIEVARENYNGPLTFSETCTSTDYCIPEHIEFWDKLDYIGFEWYVPIDVGKDATLGEITKGAEKIFDDTIEPLSKKFNKPIILTEIGFEAKPNAWSRTYEGGSEGGSDKLASAMAYDAVLKAVKDKKYVKGMMIWTWTLGDKKNLDPWVPDYNGNEVRMSIIQAELSKWFEYYK